VAADAVVRTVSSMRVGQLSRCEQHLFMLSLSVSSTRRFASATTRFAPAFMLPDCTVAHHVKRTAQLQHKHVAARMQNSTYLCPQWPGHTVHCLRCAWHAGRHDLRRRWCTPRSPTGCYPRGHSASLHTSSTPRQHLFRHPGISRDVPRMEVHRLR
jgi:hypothetical protein